MEFNLKESIGYKLQEVLDRTNAFLKKQNGREIKEQDLEMEVRGKDMTKNQHEKLKSEQPLSECWYWQDFGDGSGGLCMPDGSAFVSYDLITGEYWYSNYKKKSEHRVETDFYHTNIHNRTVMKEKIMSKLDQAIEIYLPEEMRQQFVDEYDMQAIQNVYEPNVEDGELGQVIFNKLRLRNERQMLEKADIISECEYFDIAVEIKNCNIVRFIDDSIKYQNGIYHSTQLPDFSFTADDISAICYGNERIEIKECIKQMSPYDRACISAEAYQKVAENKKNMEMEHIWDAAIEEVMEAAELAEPDFEMEM